MLQHIIQDLRYAARMFVKTPGFSSVAVLTIALGIGASTAIFTLINGVVLKPLPYRDAGRLVTVWQNLRARGGPPDEWASPGSYVDWRSEPGLFQSLAVITGWRPTMTGAGEAEPLAGEQVSHEYFDVLGVTPALGRSFSQADDVPNAARVAIIGHDLWTNRFGRDPAVLGRTLTLNGEAHQIVGVAPDRFRPVIVQDAAIWRPLRLNTGAPARGAIFLRTVARLTPGVSLDDARSMAGTLARRLEFAHPDYNDRTGITLVPLHERVVGDIRPGLLALGGAVTFVLLIACANLANLLLARGAARRRELAVRMALGAGRWRVVRQLLTESLLLAAAGGLAGILLSAWAVDALLALAPDTAPRVGEVAIDRTVLLFASLLTVATGLLFGLVPALQVSRDTASGGAGAGHGARPSTGAFTARSASFHSSRRLRQALIVAEVALALVLLSGGGLLLQTFLRLQSEDLGFDPRGVLTAYVNPPRATYDTRERTLAYYDQLLEKTAALPGVRIAALASVLPLGGDTDMSFEIEGRAPARAAVDAPTMWYRLISANYFEAMGMRLVNGRAFTAGEAAPSIVVNETLARRHFPGEDPIGLRVRSDPDAPWMTITGVAADVKAHGAREDTRAEAYIPYWQVVEPGINVVLKTGGKAGLLTQPLRQAVLSIDRNVPVSSVVTLDELVGDSIDAPRFVATLAAGFAALALALAGIGLYGVMAYAVSQRTPEIGVRIALGASPADVFRLVVGDGLKLTTLGIVLGIAGAAATAQALQSLLFGVTPGDPGTLASVLVLLLAVAALACAVPARRATRVDPVVSLRAE